MKQLLMFLCALLFALTGKAAPAGNTLQQFHYETTPDAAAGATDREVSRALSSARRTVSATDRQIDREMAEARKAVDASEREIDRQIDRAVAEARAAIDAAETAAIENQSLDELNKAAREHVVRELKLSSRQRKEFEPLYKAYREALDKAIDAQANTTATDEASQKRSLKAKLANIAATAQVKRDYVDKFAAVLTAEQIRQLYNTEGNIGTSIKRSNANRSRETRSLNGSGRMVTQNRGAAGDYSSLSVGRNIDVTISPAATDITITADDNVIDYVEAVNNGGRLELRINARSTSNISVSAVIPASTHLGTIDASSYSKVDCKMPLKGPSVKINITSGASVSADADAGNLDLTVSSYGKFEGKIASTDCTVNITSGASAQADIRCSGSCTLKATSYAKFKGDIEAASFRGDIPSGASVNGALTVTGELSLDVTSYGKFNGSMHAGTARLAALSGGVINSAFSGGSFSAGATSYGKINLKGSATVASGTIKLTSGGTFDAPDLRVGNYRITATSYAKANVFCTGKLTTETTSGGKVRYDGPCTVEALSESVRRR